MTRRFSIAAAVVLVAAGFALTTPAARADLCGATISVDTVLDADIPTCNVDPVLTVASGVTLDMNGHSVTGDFAASQECIQLNGTGDILKNGTVSRCEDNVALGGTGSHIVEGVTSKDTGSFGFRIDSMNNLLTGNKAINTFSGGYQINAPQNVLWSNSSKGSSHGVGFIATPGAGLTVLVKNTSTNDTYNGIITQSDGNRVLLNKATGSLGNGFGTTGDSNIFGGNIATSNAVGIAMDFTADNNRILGNTLSDSTSFDIASASGTPCANNVWEGNKAKKIVDPCEREVQISSPQSLGPIMCGATLFAGDWKLTEDLHCTTSPALILDGGRVDMGKHTISGNGAITCVEMKNGALLANGTVSGCLNGIDALASSPSGAIVRNVTSKNNDDNGFELASPGSIVHDNKMSGNEGHAIHGVGSANYLFRNSVSSGNGTGIDIIGSSWSLWSNTVKKTGLGFIFDTASTNELFAGNKASGNIGSGFELRGDGGFVIANKASKNKEHGLDFTSTPGAENNVVGGNKSTANKGIGIIAAASGNKLIGNTAKKNKNTDLVDGNDECTSNVWEGNTFKTRDPSCIT